MSYWYFVMKIKRSIRYYMEWIDVKFSWLSYIEVVEDKAICKGIAKVQRLIETSLSFWEKWLSHLILIVFSLLNTYILFWFSAVLIEYHDNKISSRDVWIVVIIHCIQRRMTLATISKRLVKNSLRLICMDYLEFNVW